MGAGGVITQSPERKTRRATRFLRKAVVGGGYPVKDADEFADAVEAYERAQADALYVRGLWIAEGRPLIQQSTNGLLGRHPL